ncbi:MAG: nucleotide exchange factor GrpE [Elusimicrobia bacterium]|nr:nucleotide exchange factor GrpE [bacterium]MBU0952580.1 nucleotide exchange factor GrpE [Elusimicrobiota bacterium]MBU2614119.1 nucleotide exchange factor GrpE [Elusimicrobiota bacterium]
MNKENTEGQEGLITEEELNEAAEGQDRKADDKDNQIKELNSQLLRLRAEFDNYRNRVEKEKQLKYIIGKESVLSKILDFEDIFEKALESLHHWNTDENPKDIKNVIHGVALLKKEFTSFLKKEGVRHLEVIGKKIDPMYHEVIGYELCDEEEGTIIKEVQKGYSYDEYVLRPSKVIIAKARQPEEKESKKDEEHLNREEQK